MDTIRRRTCAWQHSEQRDNTLYGYPVRYADTPAGAVNFGPAPRKVFRGVPEDWTVIDISRLPAGYGYHIPRTSTLRRLVVMRGYDLRVEPLA